MEPHNNHPASAAPEANSGAQTAPNGPLIGGLVGALLTAPLMALLYLADQWWGLPLAYFDLFDWLARVLPGDIIRAGINATVDAIEAFELGETSSTAKTIETLNALGMFFGGGVVAGVVFFLVRDRVKLPNQGIMRYAPGVLLGVVMGLPVMLISADVNTTATTSQQVNDVWLGLLFLAWGLAVNWVYLQLQARPTARQEAAVRAGESQGDDPWVRAVSAEMLNRRQFLIRVGGTTATFTVIGAAVARYLEYQDELEYEQLIEERRAATLPRALPNEGDPVEPAPGTRPEYTPLEDHYRIDINLRPAEQDEESWRLTVGGLVDNPREYTLDELRNNFEPMDQYVTLACISNRIGGDLTSTTRWTGFRLRDLLDEVGLQEDARYLRIRSVDGFHETFDLQVLEEEPDRVMLTYNWDGIPLLHRHGFPLRIYIPDRFGMKQPKWIESIEAVADYEDGYWVERGWDREARMRTVSVVDVVASDRLIEGEDGQMLVPVGGIAHAGARGISKVEVSVDEGEWVEAQLRSPLSETTWVIWRYDWPFEAGRHTFEVRCEEGDGTPQPSESRPTFPSGATGIHKLRHTL